MTTTWMSAAFFALLWLAAPQSALAAKKKPKGRDTQKSQTVKKPAEADPTAGAAPVTSTNAPVDVKAAPAMVEGQKAATATKSSGSDGLDFDLLGSTPVADPTAILKAEEIEHKAKIRRTMLLVHQGLGYGLIGLSALNIVLGSLNYYDRFGGGGYTDNYDLAHLITSMTLTGVFASAGLLALFSPDPYEKPARWDSARVHRILLGAATVGMVTQIVLGFVSAARIGNLDQVDFAKAHLGIGLATSALTIAGGLVYLF
jgi:hypothetical protein